ncbi:hypothetical protein KF913_09470 [Candidatus Obscuribacterales bacterium]|nr:hypothetical protein [Candidatus Obscuribacterales bacterium]
MRQRKGYAFSFLLVASFFLFVTAPHAVSVRAGSLTVESHVASANPRSASVNPRSALAKPHSASGKTRLQPARSRLESARAGRLKNKVVIPTSDLVKCVTPDIGDDKLGNLKEPFRQLFFPEDAPGTGYTGKVELSMTSVKQILVDGKPVIAFLGTYRTLEESSAIGNEVNVLAFFQIKAGKPVLIDAVDVSQDRFCGFATNPLLRYKAGTDAIVIANTHFNSGENFCILSPVALVDNKLTELCKDVPLLYGVRNGTAQMSQMGTFVTGKPDKSVLLPLTFAIEITCERFDPELSDKIISTEKRSFLVPFQRLKDRYVGVKNAKATKALNAFVDKIGFGDSE